ncbi:MAG TPA: tetratricopeptide repeat protein [Candidatus Binataceae bacterium]
MGILISAGAAIALAAAGCMSEAIEQNQQQIDQQKAEMERLEQQIAEIKAAQQPYSTAPPAPGSCDQDVTQAATKRGGDRFAAGDFSKALGYYQDAVTACPTSAQAQLNVARAYEALGNRDQAMDYYRRAISAAPSDHYASPAVAEQARQALSRLAAR